MKNYIILFSVIVLASCKPWQDYADGAQDQRSIFSLLEERQDLRVFKELVTLSGYDTLLRSAQNYTVWIPDNQAFQQISAELLSDKAWAKRFVANHIGVSKYSTYDVGTGTRLQKINGKYVYFTPTSWDSHPLRESNIRAKNGVIHIINTPVEPLDNTWEYLQRHQGQYLQAAYLFSREYTVVDLEKAVQIGIDPSTGQPIYEEGTGIVSKNPYLEEVAPLQDEQKEYTFFLLEDDIYRAGKETLHDFYQGVSADSIALLSQWALVRDLTVEGLVETDDFTETLVSVSGISFPISKDWVKQSVHTSNGIIHILSELPLALSTKFPSFRIEGEQPQGFSRTDRSNTIFYRVKSNPDATVFRDIQIYGHGTAQFHIRYRTENLPTGKYKVYWRAVAGNNDSQTVAFQQRLSFGDWTNQITFPYTTVPLQHYEEVFLGEYQHTKFGNLDLFLVAANTGTAGQNTLALDYIKLELVTE